MVMGYYRPIWKGKFSENLVNHKLEGLTNDYVVLNNVLLKSNGRTTQIDHVVVSPYGVFVIETKGYKGWIMGHENGEYWTQVVYRSKHKFYSPIRQNEGHVRFLKRVLKNNSIRFIPIVVFNNNATFKFCCQNHLVIHRYSLTSVIKSFNEVCLSADEVSRIVQTLQNNAVVADNENMKKHVDNVRSAMNQRIYAVSKGQCPRCGGSLVLRQGRYGTFYGCSNYPKCKFTTSHRC